MDPLDIKHALRKKGFYMADIAKRCGTTPAAVSHTVHSRPFPSPRIKEEISNILGVGKDVLWPQDKTFV